VPPVQHDRGTGQRLVLQSPQPGIAVAQHRRRRVRVHSGGGYTLGSLAVDVLKAAGPGADRERVGVGFASIKDVPTVLGNGTYTLDADRAPHYGAAIITVRNGVFVSVR